MKDGTRLKSILSLLVFLIPLLAASLILTRILQEMQYPNGPEIPGDTEILILGDSHGVCALDPGIIGRAVNFSSPGESYLHNYYKLRWFLKQEHSLKAILLPLDLHSFSDFRKDRIQ